MEARDAAVESYKKAAADRAVKLVKEEMLVGLGTGSTAQYFIEGLGRRVREGLKLQAVATSLESREQALAAGISVVDSSDRPIDLAVDGADQIDPERNCLKGRGGAMLREKIVARSSHSFVLIADEKKLVKELRGPVPVEVLAFLWEATARLIEETGGQTELRRGRDGPVRTDNGNLVLDVTFPGKLDELTHNLQAIPGVLGHGLFLGMARAAIVAGPNGIRVLGSLP